MDVDIDIDIYIYIHTNIYIYSDRAYVSYCIKYSGIMIMIITIIIIIIIMKIIVLVFGVLYQFLLFFFRNICLFKRRITTNV